MLPEENLVSFYTKYFPYDEMCEWLENSTLKKREFSFTTGDDVYMRYKSFDGAAEFKKDMLHVKPRKIDIGAIFTVPPPQHKQVQIGTFLPVEKEYVIDIDISDYDNVRLCGCKDAKFCAKCWPLMKCGMKVLDYLLSTCFGFSQLLWIYSGRRGVHCWVSDATAKGMDNEARSAVTDFLHIYSGSDKTGKRLTFNTTYPHPTFDLESDVATICEKYFVEMYCDSYSENSMDIFASKERWQKIVDLIDANDNILKKELENLLSKYETEGTVESGEDIWNEVCALLKRANRKGYILTIIYSFVYPRLDANVSKQLNHLLKSPFCVHPSTEWICVPVTSEDFYPEYDCPSVRALTEGDEETAKKWKKSVNFFKKYVKSIARTRSAVKSESLDF